MTGCDSKSANFYFSKAEKLSEQGKYEEAIVLLNKAIEKDKNYLGAYINLGADKSALEDFIGAIESYNKVLEIDSKNTLALFNIGNNHKRLNDFETAVSYYNKALDTKGGQTFYIDMIPNDFVDFSTFDVPGHEIHFERGIAYYNIDSLQLAFNDFNASINKNYMTAECYFWLGFIYISSGQKQLGCECLKKSSQLGDKDADVELRRFCNE